MAKQDSTDDMGIDNPATHDVGDDNGVDDPATHDVGDDNGVDDPATHDVGDDNGVDDPATHDVGDDNGVDDPATHDVGDDNGVDDPATHDVGDDNGVDDPATHDVGDDNGVDDPATHDVGDDNGIHRLVGSAGNDQLAGYAGDDVLDGGGGIDLARYIGQRAEAMWHKTSAGWTVTSAPDDTDMLINVERLKFSDISVALDLSGNAGIVAKTLGAVFGSADTSNEVYAGIGLYYIDRGMTYESLMQLAIDARLGAGATNRDIVDLLYTNVVGGPPREADRDYFVGLLDSGAYTVAAWA